MSKRPKARCLTGEMFGCVCVQDACADERAQKDVNTLQKQTNSGSLTEQQRLNTLTRQGVTGATR